MMTFFLFKYGEFCIKKGAFVFKMMNSCRYAAQLAELGAVVKTLKNS